MTRRPETAAPPRPRSSPNPSWKRATRRSSRSTASRPSRMRRRSPPGASCAAQDQTRRKQSRRGTNGDEGSAARSHEDIEATKAPLMDHLIELRARLIKPRIAFM